MEQNNSALIITSQVSNDSLKGLVKVRSSLPKGILHVVSQAIVTEIVNAEKEINVRVTKNKFAPVSDKKVSFPFDDNK